MTSRGEAVVKSIHYALEQFPNFFILGRPPCASSYSFFPWLELYIMSQARFWGEEKGQLGPSFHFLGFELAGLILPAHHLPAQQWSHSFWCPLAFFNHDSGFSWLHVTETPIQTGSGEKRVLLVHSSENSSAATSFRCGRIQGLRDVISVLCPHIRSALLCVDHILRWLLLSGEQGEYSSRLRPHRAERGETFFFP